MARRYPLAGLLFCGRCDHQLVSNPLRGAPSFICSPTATGGCAKIRIQADYLERYLLEQIQQRDEAALESPAQARVRAALRQLQDDHYDGLLDRADFLRQSQRLRVALARTRGTQHARPVLTDPDKRAILTRALGRVIVLPHPSGRAASHLDWAQRSMLLQDRLQLIWTT